MRLLDSKAVAAILDCAPSTVQKMWAKGDLPSQNLGNEVRIEESILMEWILAKHEEKRRRVVEKRRDNNVSLQVVSLPNSERRVV